ncbi:MAG: hypothetical protein Q4E64_10660 [Phascolarctobacterium sp.]|uniref:hypothetical protein n=1 Tax=Phascolarctobacterium sp. TaxID=2049039 RepID=UPI0026DBC68D|nr:hypothetical protein [Phascolarctobacterium sp.]MDO4922267.1 hypothetical protein [Phascolarctobacterium sp.]
MNKILMSVALCGLLAFAASGLAAAPEENKAAEPQVAAEQKLTEQKEPEEITLQVTITGHEEGRIYKVTDEQGNVLRADLGKHGGRMLNRHPFLLTAEVVQDERGELLQLKQVEYNDPAPLIEKPTAPTASAAVEQDAATPEEARDVAYSHELSKSQQKGFYQNNVGSIADEDLALYKKTEVTAIASEAAGTKVAFIGSAAATVVKDEVMRFWGGPTKGGYVKVVMNGAYVPLGQRSVVYGTVQEDGSVSLERLDSIAS